MHRSVHTSPTEPRDQSMHAVTFNTLYMPTLVRIELLNLSTTSVSYQIREAQKVHGVHTIVVRCVVYICNLTPNTACTRLLIIALWANTGGSWVVQCLKHNGSFPFLMCVFLPQLDSVYDEL